MSESYQTRHNRNPLRSDKHRAALKFGSKVRVFPCREDKSPLTPNGFKDATTDPSRITAWWTAHPDANPAAPTGEEFWVLDVDLEAWGAGSLEALENKHGPLPPTYTVKTGGGGMHFYFRVPEGVEIRNSAGKLGAGLDVRGVGGYVLLPGSITENSYDVLDRHPIAEAPAWLIKLLREPSVSPIAYRKNPMNANADGGPIREGVRNHTLFFNALDLKDAGRSREEALEELLDINQAQCSPPLEEAEVEAIVKSAFRYPIRGKRTPPEVMEALVGLKRAWWATAWRGVGGKSERDILRVLIQLAERYGYLIPAGVRISISYRDLAIAAGCGRKTVERVVKRLRLRGWIRGDNAERTGTSSGAFVLLPRPTDDTQSIASGQGQSVAESVVTSSRLPEITPCFRWRGFVGKGKAGALYVFEVFGPQSLEELAERLGFSRPRDLRRLYLDPLAGLGLIEDRGGLYALPGQERYVKRVHSVRAAPYGGGPRKVRSKDERGRWVVCVVDVSPKSEIEREEADLLDYEKDRAKHRAWLAGTLHEADPIPERPHAGTIAELKRVPEAGPVLRQALATYLRRNPHRRHEYTSWLANTLWCEELVDFKPSGEQVEAALAELPPGAVA